MPDTHLSRARLLDRNREREMLDRLVAETRAGHSRVLVLRGEAGIGKTALLGYLSGAAEGCRIARVAGIESEMELAFADLHALCAPMLGRLGHLPIPQRDALNTAFGMSAGPPPDRFLVGLAVLSLQRWPGRPTSRRSPRRCSPGALNYLAALNVHSGAFATAATLTDEVNSITEATGIPPLGYAAAKLTAARGDQPL